MQHPFQLIAMQLQSPIVCPPPPTQTYSANSFFVLFFLCFTVSLKSLVSSVPLVTGVIVLWPLVPGHKRTGPAPLVELTFERWSQRELQHFKHFFSKGLKELSLTVRLVSYITHGLVRSQRNLRVDVVCQDFTPSLGCIHLIFIRFSLMDFKSKLCYKGVAELIRSCMYHIKSFNQTKE